VTGAGGFIGSHLVERLTDLGAKVRAFVRYTSRANIGWLSSLSPQMLSKIHIVRGDLKDASAVKAAVSDMEIVFHLGALIGIPYSYVAPRETAETNLMGTLNVLMAIREVPSVERLIHTSTSEVYGTAQVVPMDEKHPLCAQSPYSATKIGADKLVESFYSSFALPSVILRPFNTFGPRQSARAVIPAIVTQALKGNEILLGSTTPIRDLTYVSDTVDGFVKAAQTPGIEGRTINLGSGVGVSIEEVVEKVGTCLGKRLTIHSDEARLRPAKSEVERLISNFEIAKNLLHWSPQVSLDSGLKMTIEWISKNLHLYKIGAYEV